MENKRTNIETGTTAQTDANTVLADSLFCEGMAFPDPMRGAEQSMMNQSPHTEQSGLTKLEYFSARAMQGLLAADAKYGGKTSNYTMLAEDAIAHAEAILKALVGRAK